MKIFFMLTFVALTSCSSAPEKRTTVAEANPAEQKEGALDKVMGNKDCGLLDVFYDGCKKMYSDAEKDYYKEKGEEAKDD